MVRLIRYTLNQSCTINDLRQWKNTQDQKPVGGLVMIELRYYQKKAKHQANNPPVLQYRTYRDVFTFKDGYGYVKDQEAGEWKDVPLEVEDDWVGVLEKRKPSS